MATLNLIENWNKEVQYLSSPLHIKPLLSREKVNTIYNTLLTSFGLKYFDIKKGESKPLDKMNWLHSLLSNSNNVGCINALYRITLLLEYSKKLDVSIQKELINLKRNPQNLRAFFLELFVFNLLDKNNIPNTKKDKINNQEIEGTCVLFGDTYLYECRKAYMPKLDELNLIMRLATEFLKHGQTINSGHGMICTISLERPLKGKHYSYFEARIKNYFKDFNKLNGKLNTIDYVVEDAEYGTFKAIDFNRADLIEIENSKKNDVIFQLIPPESVTPGIHNKYTAGISGKFNMLDSIIYKKLESILKEKKDQHKNSPFTHKIIFIESEALPELQMSMFQHQHMFDPVKIDAIYKKLNLDSIVCLIRREYSERQSKIMVDTFHKHQHQIKVCNYLKKIICSA